MQETLRPSSVEPLPGYNSSTSSSSSQAPPSYELRDLSNLVRPEKAHTLPDVVAASAPTIPASANSNVDLERDDTNVAIAARAALNTRARARASGGEFFLAGVTILTIVGAVLLWVQHVPPVVSHNFCSVQLWSYYGTPAVAFAVLVTLGTFVACASSRAKTGGFWAFWTVMGLLAEAALMGVRLGRCNRL